MITVGLVARMKGWSRIPPGQCSMNSSTPAARLDRYNTSGEFAVSYRWSLNTIYVATTIFLILIIAALWWKRWRTYRSLVKSGLPTVYWRPKFVNYQLDNVKQLSASTITNVLPRMHRLNGPYGMYGTVYGVSTAVVHVAHPVPAMALLGAPLFTASSQQLSVNNQASKHAKHASWWWLSRLLSAASNNRATTATTTTAAAGTSKAPAYNHFKNFCGEGVFTADGVDWRGKRAAVLHALLRSSGSNSISFQERIEQEAHRTATSLIQDLDQRIIGAAKEGGSSYEANIVPVLQRATIGLIYRYITHADLSSLEEHGYESDVGPESYTADESQSKGTGLVTAYLNSITRIRMIILAQSRSIWFLLPRWCYTTFAALYREEELTMGPIRQVAAKACRNAKANSPLRLLQKNPIYADGGGDAPFSKNLIDEAVTLLFAGQDTSAATLSWTLHLLTLYPHVHAKLAEEVCGVLEGIASDTVLTKKLISKMPYLDAVIKESMRLYPVAPFVVRKLGSGVEIAMPPGLVEQQDVPPSVSLPDGSLACIWIYSLHRHPQFWDRPDDFEPERWLAALSGDEKTRDLGITTPGAYIPYAAGARNCVGQPLANVMLRSLLARLIHRYEFRDERVAKFLLGAPDAQRATIGQVVQFRKDMQAGFTVLPQDGLLLSLQHRHRP